MFYKSLTASQTISIAEVLRLAEDDDAPLLLRACRLGFEVERVTYGPKMLKYQSIGIYGVGCCGQVGIENGNYYIIRRDYGLGF